MDTEVTDKMKNKISNELKIAVLEKKVEKFMESWGPDVQKKRDERDRRWDEMVRVLQIQQSKK